MKPVVELTPNLIGFSDFLKVEIRVGTIISAYFNEKARKPSYVTEIDFGTEIGVKTSSAQITELYNVADLIDRQIMAVMNFPPKRVAGIKSEVLILAIIQVDGATTLVSPTHVVGNGAILA